MCLLPGRNERGKFAEPVALSIENIVKSFRGAAALSGATLEVREGELLALLGPSGAGKTTLLRVLAGLERPDEGRIAWDGEDFLALTSRQRRVGLVFQHYALFRHMSVAENVAFGLRVRPARERPSRDAIATKVNELLALLQIAGLGERYPGQLSGGERQRVSVARALAVEPRLLLLDEPFGALDAKVRKELRGELRRIHDATGVTSILVTHDQEEAMDLADRVAVMNAGRIEQVGSPTQVELEPISAFVFDFLGETNRLPCEVATGVARCEGFNAAVRGACQDGPGVALFRPYQTLLDLDEATGGLAVRIEAVAERGPMRVLQCRAAAGDLFFAELPEHLGGRFHVGQCVRLRAADVVVDRTVDEGPRRPTAATCDSARRS